QQPSYDNVTFVEATPIDLSDGKYKLSPAAGGSTFLQDLRNPRKKSFWIMLVIVLAIIFGVLGATVWKPESNKGETPRGHGTPTSTPPAGITGPVPSNPVVPTPVGPTATPTAIVFPTPVTVSSVPVSPPTVTDPTNPDRPTTTRNPPPPTSKPTGSKDEYFRCRELCSSPWNSCHSECKSSDAAYKACVAPCNGDFICEVDCRRLEIWLSRSDFLYQD
ncbi:hypothetical protein BGZ93_011059, partial [Podila epicladia]